MKFKVRNKLFFGFSALVGFARILSSAGRSSAFANFVKILPRTQKTIIDQI